MLAQFPILSCARDADNGKQQSGSLAVYTPLERGTSRIRRATTSWLLGNGPSRHATGDGLPMKLFSNSFSVCVLRSATVLPARSVPKDTRPVQERRLSDPRRRVLQRTTVYHTQRSIVSDKGEERSGFNGHPLLCACLLLVV